MNSSWIPIRLSVETIVLELCCRDDDDDDDDDDIWCLRYCNILNSRGSKKEDIWNPYKVRRQINYRAVISEGWSRSGLDHSTTSRSLIQSPYIRLVTWPWVARVANGRIYFRYVDTVLRPTNGNDGDAGTDRRCGEGVPSIRLRGSRVRAFENVDGTRCVETA